SYITGIGADSVSASGSSSTCTTAANKYNGTKGVLASTTGNITGVYDMSGGTWEYTMGNVSSASGSYTMLTQTSGFASGWYTTSTAKYLTTYANGSSYTDQTAYNRGRLGDATGEVVLSTGDAGGWYSDNAGFPSSGNAWFNRGAHCHYGSSAGVFCFRYNGGGGGGVGSSLSSRAILVSFLS
ncbi:MAG: hypothetical protein MR550_02210, partial [Bacilli bacterium]|nr:hypothetical protein [Bacilli bacterium]